MYATKTLNNSHFKLSSVDNRFFLTQCFLVSIHSLLLLGFVLYQFIQPLFLNLDTWVSVYLFLSLSFSIDSIYFYLQDKVKNKVWLQWLYLFSDAVLMTACLSVAVPFLQSVLIFIYMLQIFGAGLIGQYRGAFAQGLLVSALFSWVLVLNPGHLDSSHSLVFSFILNNIGFVAIAGLSGLFGFQATRLKGSLLEADKVVSRLGNLNKLIVDNINMGLFIVDQNGQIVHSNKASLDILNLSSSFSLDAYQIFPALKKHIKKNKKLELKHLEEVYLNKEENKSIEIFLSSFKSTEEDGVYRYLVLFQDCTEMRGREKKQREKEKFASIGRMATGIAHELRNPLSSIGGSIQLLDVHNKDAAENKRLMNIALRETTRLNKIIADFLDYAADEDRVVNRAKIESVQLNSLLEELLDEVRVNSRWEHIQPHFLLQSRALVEGHRDKFKQILLNVIKNACESMENQPIGKLEIESFDDKEWLVIRVKDTGVGLPEEESQLCEPFYSTKEKGSGLGLAIVRKLVRLYKGHLNHENRKPEGTVCTLRFPIQPHFEPGEMAKRKSA